MALPNFPTATAVGQLETLNGITWRVRTLVPVFWEPLAFNVQNYFVSPEMFGAAGDNTRDDTDAMSAFFAASAKTKVLRPGATYLVNNRFTVSDVSDLVIIGNGARINRPQTDGMYPGEAPNPNTGYASTGIDQHILVLLRCKNVQIDGVRIRGGYNPAAPWTAGLTTSYWGNSQTNGRGENGHGISIVQCEDVLVENCEVVNVWGDAFWITSGGQLGDASLTANKNIVIRNNDIRNPFRGCFSSVHHYGLVFDNNYCEKYTGYTSAMLLEPNSNIAQNCVSTVITKNTVTAASSSVFAATSNAPLLSGDYIRNIAIRDNIVSGSVFCALTSPNLQNVDIEDNVYANGVLIANANQFGLFLLAVGAKNIKVNNNTDNSGGTSADYYRGVRVDSCTNVSFRDHTITPLDDKANTEYFQIIDTVKFRLSHSEINGRNTTDPNGTGIVVMYGTSSYCEVIRNRFNGAGTTQGVVYLEQSTYTGTGNEFSDNIVTSSAGSNAVVLKTNHFGTVVGKNNFTSGRVSNVAGGAPQCYQHPTALDARIVYSYGTAAPTTGTGAVGSRVYNLGAGPTDYWECTAAGSPGTWTARN